MSSADCRSEMMAHICMMLGGMVVIIRINYVDS